MPRSTTETLVRLLGLYFLLSGAGDLLYGAVQMARFNDAPASFWLGGIGPLLVGFIILMLSRQLADFAHCEEVDRA